MYSSRQLCVNTAHVRAAAVQQGRRHTTYAGSVALALWVFADFSNKKRSTFCLKETSVDCWENSMRIAVSDVKVKHCEYTQKSGWRNNDIFFTQPQEAC